MNELDAKTKIMLDDLEENYALPKRLNVDQRVQAVELVERLITHVKMLYGADLTASYKVTVNGANLYIEGYAIYSAYDFICFIEEISGLSNYLLEEITTSFYPSTSAIITQMLEQGIDSVIDAYMPTSEQLACVDTTITHDNLPAALLRGISKAHVIKAFICECLNLEASDDQVILKLTITKLVIDITIKRNGRYYKIEGVNDVHNALLGLEPTNDFSHINEDCMIKMYKKIGIGYIPDLL